MHHLRSLFIATTQRIRSRGKRLTSFLPMSRTGALPLLRRSTASSTQLMASWYPTLIPRSSQAKHIMLRFCLHGSGRGHIDSGGPSASDEGHTVLDATKSSIDALCVTSGPSHSYLVVACSCCGTDVTRSDSRMPWIATISWVVSKRVIHGSGLTTTPRRRRGMSASRIKARRVT